jgi:dodecin
MEDHVYRLSEVVGTSSEGIDQAIRNAVARANRTLRNLDWFQVSEIRGVISGGEVAQYQVTLKLGFRLEE